MAKVMLTEEQRTDIEILVEAIENPDLVGRGKFTETLFKLKDAGVDVNTILQEEYGIDL